MASPVQSLVDEATFDFTLGDHEAALRKLQEAVSTDPACAAAWHAMAEVCFDQGDHEKARDAGLKAVALKEDDVHLHTTLSRIYMELGDKPTAEKHGARARVLGWKSQLQGEDD